jgi:hypothetical protein
MEDTGRRTDFEEAESGEEDDGRDSRTHGVKSQSIWTELTASPLYLSMSAWYQTISGSLLGSDISLECVGRPGADAAALVIHGCTPDDGYFLLYGGRRYG